MWRLKIADGSNNPYLYNTNNFVGRQTWEFDPNYGTQEELDEVEQARLHFWNHTHEVKPSSDVLWRMQVALSLFTIFHAPFDGSRLLVGSGRQALIGLDLALNKVIGRKIPRTCSSVADWLRISSGSYAAGGIYHGRPLVHMLIGLIGSIPSD
ncbi:beta-amyrin synthase [Tanacetum coccineum]